MIFRTETSKTLQRIELDTCLIWLIAWIVLSDKTGWAWYWVALFLIGWQLIHLIVDAIRN